MPPTEKNKAKRFASVGGQPLHINGSVGAAPEVQEISFNSGKKLATKLVIQNTHATQTLEVRLDGTVNGFTLTGLNVPERSRLVIECEIDEFTLEGSGAATTFEAIVTF